MKQLHYDSIKWNIESLKENYRTLDDGNLYHPPDSQKQQVLSELDIIISDPLFITKGDYYGGNSIAIIKAHKVDIDRADAILERIDELREINRKGFLNINDIKFGI